MRRVLLCPALLLSASVACTRANFDASSRTDDPIAFFASLAQMPEEQQDFLLEMAGESLMDQYPEIDCNIFGGVKSCKKIPDKSKFGSACKTYRDDLKVDCAYFSDSEKLLEIHPGDALQHHLGADYNKMSKHCPECVENLQALWCVQALPECGTFHEHVHQAIFPAILEIKNEEDMGLPESTAVAAAIPPLVEAMSRTMACREMCHATVSACSCGNATLSFGEALENAEINDQGFADLGLQMLGQNFSDTLFAGIWDKSVCDIFTPKDDPNFAGECTEAVVNKDSCTSDAFCTDLSDQKRKSAESVIATQIARSVFGFVDGPAGILDQGNSVAQTVAQNGGSLPQKKPGTGVGAWTPATTTASTTTTTTTQSSTHTSATAAAVSSDGDSSSGDASSTVLPTVQATEDSSNKASKKKGSAVGTFFGAIFGLAVIGAIGTFAWKKYQDYKLRSRGFADFAGYDPMGTDEGIPLQ